MKMTIIIKCLLACFISAIITAPAYSESGFYSKYSTIRADIVGILETQHQVKNGETAQVMRLIIVIYLRLTKKIMFR